MKGAAMDKVFYWKKNSTRNIFLRSLRIFISLSTLILIFSVLMPDYASPAGVQGSPCSQVGKIKISGSNQYVCSKIKNSLIWTTGKSKKTGNKSVIPVTADQYRFKTSFGNCTAYIPKNYTTLSDKQGWSGEFWSEDKKLYGVRYLQPVNTSQAKALQDQFYGIDPKLDSADPKVQVLAAAGIAAKSMGYDNNFVQVSESLDSNGYTGFKAQSSNAQAIVIYKNPIIPGDGFSYNYIAVGRIAIAPLSATERELNRVARDMLSIDCTAQLSPPSSNAFSSSAHSKPKKGIGSEPTTQEENANLGTAWVTDPEGASGALVNVDLDRWSADPCGKGQSGWAVVDANGCRVIGH